MNWIDSGNVVTLCNKKSMCGELIVLVLIMDQSSFHGFLSSSMLNMTNGED